MPIVSVGAIDMDWSDEREHMFAFNPRALETRIMTLVQLGFHIYIIKIQSA